MAIMARLPTFVVAGVAGCGSRWLRFNLNEHPDIYLPPFPLDFFADGVPVFEGPPFGDGRRTPREGVRWYRHQFMVPEELPCVGDASPAYLAGLNDPRTVAERIDEVLPEAPVVVLIRHPLDRLEAVALDQARRGRLDPEANLFELVRDDDPVVEDLDLVRGGLYAWNLVPFLELLGDRVLIVMHEDVLADPAGAYLRVLDHIGADPDFVPDGLERPVFSDPPVEAPRPLSEAERRQLYGLFREDVEELDALLGRSLRHWDPGPPDC